MISSAVEGVARASGLAPLGIPPVSPETCSVSEDQIVHPTLRDQHNPAQERWALSRFACCAAVVASTCFVAWGVFPHIQHFTLGIPRHGNNRKFALSVPVTPMAGRASTPLDVHRVAVEPTGSWLDTAIDNWIIAGSLLGIAVQNSKSRNSTRHAGIKQQQRATIARYLRAPHTSFSTVAFLGSEAMFAEALPCCNFRGAPDLETPTHSLCRGLNTSWNWSQADYEYRRVYKSGNNFVCHAMRQSPPRKPSGAGRSFTVVRNPLSHFISGYTEMVFRNKGASASRARKPAFLTAQDIHERARLFIRGLLQCTVTNRGVRDLAHIFPQVAFLRGAHVDDYYHMSSLHLLFNVSTMPRTAQLMIAAANHPDTVAQSGNPHRAAMEKVLQNEAYLCAVARMVAHDYACFGFSFPPTCGPLPVQCPVQFNVSSQSQIRWMDNKL